MVVLSSAEELWARAADHDLVVVATPNATHVPLALAALGSGLPVVVDKPMALTAADGRRLQVAAADAGLLLTVFHNRRWDSDTLTVRRMMSGGAEGIGPVMRFESRFERFRPDVDAGAWKEQPGADAGGGVLLDLGTHVVDTALWLFGRPLLGLRGGRCPPAGRAGRRRRVHGADAPRRCPVAPRGQCRRRRPRAARAAARPRRRADDSRGSTRRRSGCARGTARTQPGWGAEPPGRWGYLTTRAGTRRLEPERGSYPAFYAGVRDALRSGAPPPVEPADAVAVLDVLDAARHSSRTKLSRPAPVHGLTLAAGSAAAQVGPPRSIRAVPRATVAR